MSAADRLNQIEARANAATKGPWQRYGTWPYEVYAPREPDGGPYIASVTGTDGDNEGNADFIAHARDDVPWLIEQVRKRDAALQAVLDLHAPDPYCGNTHHDPNRCPCSIMACADGCDTYPCPTVRAIEEALS